MFSEEVEDWLRSRPELKRDLGTKLTDLMDEILPLKRYLDKASLSPPPIEDLGNHLVYESVQDTYARKTKELKRIRMALDVAKGLDKTRLYTPTLDLTQIKEIPIEDLFTPDRPYTSHQRLKALCPFHKETTPSFTIYKNTNSFYCFGCNAYGDNIEFVKRFHSCSFGQALSILKGYL
jgi:hypothetical protein